MATQCRDMDPLIHAYLDDELANSDLREFEQHITDCEGCAENLAEEENFHRVIRERLATPPTPDLLRKRLMNALDAEDRAIAARSRRDRLGWILPAAASATAAAALVAFVVTDSGNPGSSVSSAVSTPASSARVQNEPVIGLSVVETGSPIEVAQAAREFVRRPVKPPRFRSPDATLLGWQRARLQGHEAAVFVYDVTGPTGRHVVRVHTLDATSIEFRSVDRRVVDGHEIWVTSTPTTVSYKDSKGVGYVFSSDMSLEDLVSLVLNSDLVLLVGEQLHGN